MNTKKKLTNQTFIEWTNKRHPIGHKGLARESVAIDCQFIDLLYNKYVWFWLITSLEAIFFSDYTFKIPVSCIVDRLATRSNIIYILLLVFLSFQECHKLYAIPKETKRTVIISENRKVRSIPFFVSTTMIDRIKWSFLIESGSFSFFQAFGVFGLIRAIFEIEVFLRELFQTQNSGYFILVKVVGYSQYIKLINMYWKQEIWSQQEIYAGLENTQTIV